MVIKEYVTPLDFLHAAENFLLQDECFYNLKLGIPQSVIEGKIESKNPLFLSIHDDQGELVGCALNSHSDFPVPITKMSTEALKALADHLAKKDFALKGVVGEIATVETFARIWCSKKSVQKKLAMHMGLYEAHQVIIPPHHGKFLVVQVEYRDVLKTFLEGFMLDCFPDKPLNPETIEKQCERHLKNKTIYMYQNEAGEIVSMAANSRNSANGGTISLVYTPVQFRGRGYGSIVTALVTQEILKTKKFANLFTDLTNPTSNSIYQKIGFRKIGENLHLEFV